MSAVSAKDLLVMNPLLYSELEKYIWIEFSEIEHRQAQQLFIFLMKMNLYIDGFVTDDLRLSGLKMYNKMILDIHDIEKNHSVIFCDPLSKDADICIKRKKQLIKIINPEIDRENIVIWGAGATGEYVYRFLESQGIGVKCFVDSNKTLEGIIKCGVPVYTPEYLTGLMNDVTIIEAMKQWEELDRCIADKCDKRFHYSLGSYMENQTSYRIEITEKMILNLSDFYIFSRFVGKKIYIYGKGAAEKEFAKLLNLMDFEFAGFLIDESDNLDKLEDDEEIAGYVEEILYEDNYYIWVYENTRGSRLRELGLKYYLEYECAVFDWDTIVGRKNPLDINLGYNYYFSGMQYPGFTILGNDSRDDYKIAVLGSSTTDGALYPFKSWPELLYEELDEKITIYNGGVAGYVSGQELLKLIRDVLLLKPDMILVYDGYSDLYTDVQYPFAFSYAKTVFEYANAHLEDNFIKGQDNSVCFGVPSERDKMSNWLSNIRSMYAIASERNIKFFSFYQPRLSDKRGKTTEEKNMLLSMPGDPETLLNEGPSELYLSQIPDKPEYMYDLSHIFDGESGIYMDLCHVWEKGNRIIAREIKKIIEPYLNKSI